MSTQAQHQVRLAAMSFVESHPGIAVREYDRPDGGVELLVHGAPFPTCKQAVDELGELFAANSHLSTADRYAAAHLPAADEPQWLPSEVADVIVWARRKPANPRPTPCPTCKLNPCICGKGGAR